MNIVFGSLVGHFNQYFTPGAAPSEETFKASINKSRFVLSRLTDIPGFGKLTLKLQSLHCLSVHWKIYIDIRFDGKQDICQNELGGSCSRLRNRFAFEYSAYTHLRHCVSNTQRHCLHSLSVD